MVGQDNQRVTIVGMTGNFGPAVGEAVRALSDVDPVERARAMGARFVDGAFHFPCFGDEARIAFPSGACALGDAPCGGTMTVLLLHYVLQARDLAAVGVWISFREIPDSAAYLAAYRRRGPGLIAETFGEDADGFSRACARVGGRRDPSLPGLGYVVPAFPRLPVAVILYEGEPDLPAEAQILFDRTAPEFWSAEDLAVLGEVTAAKLALAR